MKGRALWEEQKEESETGQALIVIQHEAALASGRQRARNAQRRRSSHITGVIE